MDDDLNFVKMIDVEWTRSVCEERATTATKRACCRYDMDLPQTCDPPGAQPCQPYRIHEFEEPCLEIGVVHRKDIQKGLVGA